MVDGWMMRVKALTGSGSQDGTPGLILLSPRPPGRPNYGCKVCGDIIPGEDHQLYGTGTNDFNYAVLVKDSYLKSRQLEGIVL